MNGPAYLPLLLRHVEELGTIQPGDVLVVVVRHDDDCARWRGGVCDCEPVVLSRPREEAR